MILSDYDREFYGDDEEEMPVCLHCGSDVDTNLPHIESYDGVFCDMGCCQAYYEIRRVYS